MKGSEQWIEQWVTHYGDPLVRFVGTYTHDYQVSQDIVQETFFRLYREHLRHPTKVFHAGWLYIVARRLAIDYHRRKPPSSRNIDDMDWSAAIEERALDVDRIMDRLPALDRELLLLFYYQERSIAELADHYAISVHTVKSRLHRARNRFRRHWMKEGAEDNGS